MVEGMEEEEAQCVEKHMSQGWQLGSHEEELDENLFKTSTVHGGEGENLFGKKETARKGYIAILDHDHDQYEQHSNFHLDSKSTALAANWQ